MESLPLVSIYKNNSNIKLNWNKNLISIMSNEEKDELINLLFNEIIILKPSHKPEKVLK
jgi:hypothetical protein